MNHIHNPTIRTTTRVVMVLLAVLTGCTRSEPAAGDAESTTAATAPSIAPPTTTPVSPASTPGSTPATGAPADDGGTPMSEDAIKAVVDPGGESASMTVLAWGDVDDDGDEDAVVMTGFCGASCGNEVDLILDEDSVPVLYEFQGDAAFAPWFVGGGAAQSSLTAATIDGSMITLTGTGLCGDLPVVETDEPGACNYTVERTATYLFNDGTIEPISIEPEPG